MVTSFSFVSKGKRGYQKGATTATAPLLVTSCSFKNKGKQESDIIFLEWADNLDDVLKNIDIFQRVDKLKIRVTKYKRIKHD